MFCFECGGNLIAPQGNSGEIVCQKCGLVINNTKFTSNYIKWKPDWFSNWEKMDSPTLKEWLTILRIVSGQLNLANFPYREEAARTIRLKSNTLFRSQRFGKNKREAIVALIQIILQKYNELQPIKEICEKLSLNEKLVMRYSWDMRKIIVDHKRFSSEDYLKKYGIKLVHSEKIIRKTEELLKKIGKYSGGNPISLAAGALYYVLKKTGKNISKVEIGKIFHISDRTVYCNERKIHKLIQNRGISLSM